MKNTMKKPITLIIGANSGIAKVLAKPVAGDDGVLIVITRHSDFYQH